jgi:hypothetical protein
MICGNTRSWWSMTSRAFACRWTPVEILQRCLTLPATTFVAVKVKAADTFWIYFSILDTTTYNANPQNNFSTSSALESPTDAHG